MTVASVQKVFNEIIHLYETYEKGVLKKLFSNPPGGVLLDHAMTIAKAEAAQGMIDCIVSDEYPRGLNRGYGDHQPLPENCWYVSC